MKKLINFLNYLETNECKQLRPALFWTYNIFGTLCFFLCLILITMIGGGME